MATVDLERAALVLVDAIALGDKTTADKWRISTKTVERYRERLRSDPELSALVDVKKAVAESEWRTVRLRFLRRAISKLDELVAQAGVEQMRDVTGAVKIVGELETIAGALHDDPVGDQPGQGASPRSRQSPEEEGREPPVH